MRENDSLRRERFVKQMGIKPAGKARGSGGRSSSVSAVEKPRWRCSANVQQSVADPVTRRTEGRLLVPHSPSIRHCRRMERRDSIDPRRGGGNRRLRRRRSQIYCDY